MIFQPTQTLQYAYHASTACQPLRHFSEMVSDALDDLSLRCTCAPIPRHNRVMTQATKNVLGEDLVPCSFDPLTGFFRDGCCNTSANDHGTHVICARVTAEFLAFSKARGNDLTTPRPEHRFAGLKPGDRWCLCANRWVEALHAGVAPPVVLVSTHMKALAYVSLDELRQHAWAPA